MYLEAEVYGLLNLGFKTVMGIQLIFIIAFWYKHKYIKEAFTWLISYVTFFSLAGYKLIEAIHTFEHNNPMGSENASLSIGTSGVLWVLSVVCLLIGLTRLIANRA